MSKRMDMVFRGNVNTATLKAKTLDGVDYLVGPVVMAREIVMNGLFYPAKEIAASVPHWNNRPVVVSHPKDAEGEYISANEVEVLDKTGAGLLFNTSFDKKTTKLKADVWLKVSKLSTFPAVNKSIEDGEMMEVSTGVFVEKVPMAGTFGDRDYTAIAVNYKPDHLALLPGDVGACSIKDGAGFPRVNCLETNDVSITDKYTVLGKAVRKTHSITNSMAYIEEIFDDYLIFTRYEEGTEGYTLYKIGYSIGADEQTVTFNGTPTKVLRKITYVDIVATNVLQHSSTEDTSKTQPASGDKAMNKQEQINKLLADKLITANEQKVLEGMTDEQFAVANKFRTPTPPNADAKKGEEEDTEEGEDTEDEKDGVEGNKKSEVPPVTEKPAKTTPEVNEDDAWAKAQIVAKRAEYVKAITANKANAFTKAELEGMHMPQLEKMASLAGNTTDMTAAGTPAPKAPAPAGNSAKKITPYVQPHMRSETK